MARKLNPFSGRQFLDANGDPYSGAKLFSYEEGTFTKATLTQDQAGVTSHTNPILLNTKGEPADAGGASQPMWQADGVGIKLVLAPADDTDPPVAAISTWDELEGINDTAVSGGGAEWVTGATPTYVSATSLTLVGDVTTTYHPGRRIKTTNSGGTIYSTISASVYTTLTTLTVVNDSGTLDSGLSAVEYSILSSTNRALPTGKGADLASAATMTIGTDGRFFDVTGTTTITAINPVSVGTEVEFQFDDILTLTHHATNLILPGGANITTAAGDVAKFREYASGDWYCSSYTPAINTLMSHDHSGGDGATITEDSHTAITTGATYRHAMSGTEATATTAAMVRQDATLIVVPRTGTYQVSFEMRTDNASNLATARVYRDASTAYTGEVAFGTSQTTTSVTYVEKTEASLSLNAGDVLVLYAMNAATNTLVRNLTLESAVKLF